MRKPNAASDRRREDDWREERFPAMTPRRAVKAKNKREKRARATAWSAAAAVNSQADPDKSRVMAHFRSLVADGLAEWHTLDDGTIRLSLSTGEIYLVRETAITRIA